MPALPLVDYPAGEHDDAAAGAVRERRDHGARVCRGDGAALRDPDQPGVPEGWPPRPHAPLCVRRHGVAAVQRQDVDQLPGSLAVRHGCRGRVAWRPRRRTDGRRPRHNGRLRKLRSAHSTCPPEGGGRRVPQGGGVLGRDSAQGVQRCAARGPRPLSNERRVRHRRARLRHLHWRDLCRHACGRRDGEPAERQADRGGEEADGLHQPVPLRQPRLLSGHDPRGQRVWRDERIRPRVGPRDPHLLLPPPTRPRRSVGPSIRPGTQSRVGYLE
mmetsp:Transcript_7261/g.16011  ORF Transcript_7261/g.16011 Transcript_7261/m.16011 type:complete len:272 (+) Transcript_7261:1020-1835(+)